MTLPPLGTVCEHGALARSCLICDYEQQIVRLSALLRRLEWGGPVRVALGYEVCPLCSSWSTHGHAPGCELHETLRVERVPDPAAE